MFSINQPTTLIFSASIGSGVPKKNPPVSASSHFGSLDPTPLLAFKPVIEICAERNMRMK